MENLNVSAFSIISLLVPLMTMIISIFYASKKLNTEAFLLVSGSVVVFAVAVFFVFMPSLVQSRNMPIEIISVYYNIAGVITFMGSLMFAIGFFMLVLKVIRQNEAVEKL